MTAKPTQPNQPSLPAHFDAPSSRPGSNLLPPPTTWASVLGSSSTSTKIQEEKQMVIPNASAHENAVTSASMTVQEENSSLIKEPLGKSSAQVHLRKMLKEESLLKNSSEPSIRMAKHQPPLLLRWNDEQNTAWTALGIPAAPSASGLQCMSQSCAILLFLQPLEISSQSRWQCPIPPHIPTFAPTPASMPYPAHMSSVPLPVAPIPVVPDCLTVPFSSSAYETVQPSASSNWLAT